MSIVVIGHDNIGDQGVGWYLEHVEIEAPNGGELAFNWLCANGIV